MENSPTSVIVKLELGHQASLRSHPTQDGFTHDWTVFVRGIEGSNIHHFIDKVVFYLHESFPKPKRVAKEPPYQVSESGYAGFIMPIEVYFKNKEEPKKVKFEYDLYLRLEGPPVNHVRYEKLTFQNPVDDFRRKLLKAGGIGSVVNTNGGNVATVQTHSTSGHGKSDNIVDNQKLTVTKVASFHGQEKKKQHSISKELKNQTTISRISQPFTDIFGTPIKTKPSPDHTGKSKECTGAQPGGQKASTGHKSVKTSSNCHSSWQSVTKEGKSGRPPKDKTDKEAKEWKQSKSGKHSDKEAKQPAPKRCSSPASGQNGDGLPGKKRPRSASTSSENSSVPSTAGDKRDAPRTKSKEPKSKDKHRSKSSAADDPGPKKERPKDKVKPPKHKKAAGETARSGSPAEAEDSKAAKWRERCKTPTENTEGTETVRPEEGNSSPSSSISLSPLAPGGSHGPLATMMAEMEKDLLSPMSSEPGSPAGPDSPAKDGSEGEAPPEPGRPEAEASTKGKKEEEAAARPRKEEADRSGKEQDGGQGRKEEAESNGKVRKEASGKHTGKREAEEREEKKQSSQMESSYLKELIELQQRIMSLRDRHLLQKIVDVIEETGQYNISRSSFDFDLCLLDHNTVRKLQSCLTVK